MAYVHKPRFPTPHYTHAQRVANLVEYCKKNKDYFLLSNDQFLQSCRLSNTDVAKAVIAASEIFASEVQQ